MMPGADQLAWEPAAELDSMTVRVANLFRLPLTRINTGLIVLCMRAI
jgi:hypothetical protein